MKNKITIGFVKEWIIWKYKKFKSKLDKIDMLNNQQINGYKKFNIVHDLPDPRDYKVAALPKPRNMVLIPREFSIYKKAVAMGYKSLKQSRNSCTAYMRTGIAEVCNTIWNEEVVRINAELLWRYQCQTGGSPDFGDFIQNAYKQYHNKMKEYPDLEYGRMRFTGDELILQMKLFLLKTFTGIGTGILWKFNKDERVSNYEKMKDTGIYDPNGHDKLGGHAAYIHGWDSEGWLLKESEEEQWGNLPRGTFKVLYKDTERIFSKYTCKDARDK